MFFAALAAPKKFSGFIGLPANYQGSSNNLKVLKGKPVWLLVGKNDLEWIGFAKITAKNLKKARAKIKLEILEGQGHSISIEPKKLFDWMDKN